MCALIINYSYTINHFHPISFSSTVIQDSLTDSLLHTSLLERLVALERMGVVAEQEEAQLVRGECLDAAVPEGQPGKVN